ncbi:MAG TPA: T9SS type A sorting domain-containing protein [Bacteroidia bacterium]|jgi:hypothetical protein
MRNKIVILLLFCCSAVLAQISPILNSFQVSRYQNSILVDWEIASGNLCTGLKVEHSTDSINFVSIYDYPGVCGNSSVSERYSFIHTNPSLNVRNYYRINLNTNGVSAILGISFIKIETIGYTLFPMPLEAGSRLYFSNDNNENAALVIYNSSGAKVYQSEPAETNEFFLGNLSLPLGIYHFNIIMADRKNVEGKFIVGK